MEKDKYSKEIKESPFGNQLEELIFITKKLRSSGLFILLGLIAVIIIFATLTLFARRLYFDDRFIMYKFSLFSWVFGVTFLLMGVFMLYRFNALRNRGMIIYDEITEEIDWSSKRKEFIHRPSIDTRIIIKEFLKSTDLPFTSGSNGQAFYLILYVLICLATIIMTAFVH
jgi:hypothetical protein